MAYWIIFWICWYESVSNGNLSYIFLKVSVSLAYKWRQVRSESWAFLEGNMAAPAFSNFPNLLLPLGNTFLLSSSSCSCSFSSSVKSVVVLFSSFFHISSRFLFQLLSDSPECWSLDIETHCSHLFPLKTVCIFFRFRYQLGRNFCHNRMMGGQSVDIAGVVTLLSKWNAHTLKENKRRSGRIWGGEKKGEEKK